jgi:hypothetical protein
MNNTLLKATSLLKDVVKRGGSENEIARAAAYLTVCNEYANMHDQSFSDNKIESLADKYFNAVPAKEDIQDGVVRRSGRYCWGYDVGDIINFELIDGEEVEAIAVRKDTDGMLFIFVDCLKKEYPMNNSWNNTGGYEESDLKWKLNGKILDSFPSDIRNQLVKFPNGDFLRIPTEKEIFGKNFYGEKELENVQQFEPMKRRRNRIAFQGKEGDLQWYWLQNKVISSVMDFAYVSYGCSTNDSCASSSYGIRPCFKISHI